jgi:hypothetical protein
VAGRQAELFPSPSLIHFLHPIHHNFLAAWFFPKNNVEFWIALTARTGA